ncbi:hypothetical protein LSH36_340g05032 [Paralvinella palmiformis]|uniref:Uncharacterized protein n=1 Tax=Paralvinella palmiformis TaxID=53620 RepID=A0AAD9JFP8_9ANNE|nr:hypothetical protein LSH36_340g05032 [Paralvinella palmiformis]
MRRITHPVRDLLLHGGFQCLFIPTAAIYFQQSASVESSTSSFIIQLADSIRNTADRKRSARSRDWNIHQSRREIWPDSLAVFAILYLSAFVCFREDQDGG